MAKSNAFEIVSKLTRKPSVWSKYTAADLWTDKHISQQMLNFHLDPESEPASRPHQFIDKSALWIATRFDLKSATNVLDCGCGPGLYTSRYHDYGANVTGVDFSPRSIEYARNQAETESRSINYIQSNYLDLELPAVFDLVTMIYCDFCALSPVQRKKLLHRISSMLRPDGHFLFDVFSIGALESRPEGSEIARNLMGGFWSASDYVGVRQTWKYPDENVVLDRYDIYEQDQTRTIYNWLQYFGMESLQTEMASNGFRIIEWYSDVSGAPYDEESPTIAVVVEKVG